MKVAMLTREYPPNVYGGAGVHVEHLARELARLIDVQVRYFGPPRNGTTEPGSPVVWGYQPWDGVAGPEEYRSALATMSVDLAMAAGLEGFDLVHSHTWYTNFAGHLAKLLHGLPHVVTSHSLEPLRPWKVQQLGVGGYALSSFCERIAMESADAIVAVSEAMRADVLRTYPSVSPDRVEVIHNGIDPDEYRPDHGTGTLERHGVREDEPIVLFVGRITRQKGITHLLQAAHWIDPRAQLVLAASSPDTEEIGREVAEAVERVGKERSSLVWIQDPLSRPELVQLYTHATVFLCPSIYEPLGIVNLEAMACETPVVATRTGGIPEVVDDGVTGYLVPFEPVDDASSEPREPERFAEDIASLVNRVLGDPERAREMGQAARQRVMERFTWAAIAERTLTLYQRTVERVALRIAEASRGT